MLSYPKLYYLSRMEMTDILKAASSGEMPKVKYLGENKYILKYSQSRIGTVSTIKINSKHQGVGVQFEGMEWEEWFHNLDHKDKRSKYIHELELAP